MTILALRKVTLAGLAQDRKVMLSGLQRMGCLHLIPLRPKLAADPDRTSIAPAEEAYKALRWISDVAEKRQQVKDKGAFDFDRCQPWRAKRRLVVPGSREAALLTRRALRQRGSKVG
ncbi:MAG: V-type ATP synthase subunit I, partial [gamma proteobacterium endosymbiont of Lamellibrachia anaximandri]|nr:V-type ATP synthase subunit I [gamma proteobacterium endosymbiont of Lamellibrachia anaximandri]